MSCLRSRWGESVDRPVETASEFVLALPGVDQIICSEHHEARKLIEMDRILGRACAVEQARKSSGESFARAAAAAAAADWRRRRRRPSAAETSIESPCAHGGSSFPAQRHQLRLIDSSIQMRCPGAETQAVARRKKAKAQSKRLLS